MKPMYRIVKVGSHPPYELQYTYFGIFWKVITKYDCLANAKDDYHFYKDNGLTGKVVYPIKYSKEYFGEE